MTVEAALGQVWDALDGGPRPARVRFTGPPGTLASPLPVATLAQATVAGCALAAAGLRAAAGHPITSPVPVDSAAVATAFVSERVLRRSGTGFDTFAPLSRFWPAADGWVRTHANYPHHRARLLALLGVHRDEQVGPALAERSATELEESAAALGALVFAVRTPEQWLAHPQGAAVAALPLLRLERVGDCAPSRPARPRVLDLTRVIAGPVGTRTLALFGADVLRVDSPRLPEIEAQHLDTGFGKRSTLLDLVRPTDRRTFEELLAQADVVITGYRPGALDAVGLSAPALHERRPGLVVAQLSAWGDVGPWAGRRGFDSLVQAPTGVAVRCGSAEQPAALPAQALDHGTGYLLAAAVLRALAQRAERGGGWLARLALARTAHWLLHEIPAHTQEPAEAAQQHTAQLGELTYALPPVHLPGEPSTWSDGPVPWGTSRPTWLA
jgi:crotonobetainyl-CoA:carnitine CoA-transferase CaiB-like acyl-CoA transferase